MLSPTARGIWIDLLCAMHKNNRSGEISGSIIQLSRVTRCTIDEFQSTLDELESTKTANVTNSNKKITIINRRMQKESKERESTRERVKKHRIKLEKKVKCNKNVPKSNAFYEDEDESESKIGIKDESEIKIKGKSKEKKYSGYFEEFWVKYPKKVGKYTAYKSWKKIDPSTELIEKIINAVIEQSKSEQWNKENGQYILNPTTWLNQERWNDELTKQITELSSCGVHAYKVGQKWKEKEEQKDMEVTDVR